MSKVTNMSEMFNGASSFNQPLNEPNKQGAPVSALAFLLSE